MRAESIVLVNTGAGKGKSSAAFGVMCRSWARGWNVVVVQFLKSEKWKAGERKLADHLGIEWHTLGDGFTWESTDLEETAAKGRHAWQVAAGLLASGKYDMVILDEVTYAMKYGWVPVDEATPRLAAVTAPTLLIVGSRDATVLTLNRAAQAQMRCETSLTVIPGATHLFEEPGTLAIAAETARDWFVSHLAPNARAVA